MLGVDFQLPHGGNGLPTKSAPARLPRSSQDDALLDRIAAGVAGAVLHSQGGSLGPCDRPQGCTPAFQTMRGSGTLPGDRSEVPPHALPDCGCARSFWDAQERRRMRQLGSSCWQCWRWPYILMGACKPPWRQGAPASPLPHSVAQLCAAAHGGEGRSRHGSGISISYVEKERRMHTILIVDDVASQRELLRAWLQDDYTVYTAADVATGLALAAQTEPDLMFLALPLPDRDGGEVARRIKTQARLRDIPLIALTAYALPGEDSQE